MEKVHEIHHYLASQKYWILFGDILKALLTWSQEYFENSKIYQLVISHLGPSQQDL